MRNENSYYLLIGFLFKQVKYHSHGIIAGRIFWVNFKINKEKEEGETYKEGFLTSILKADVEKEDGRVLKHHETFVNY